MLKSQQHYSSFCLFGSIAGEDGARIILGFFSCCFNLIRRSWFPCEHPSGADDSPSVHCSPDLFIIEAFSDSLVFEKAVNFFGFGSIEELTVLRSQLGELNLSATHLFGHVKHRVALKLFPLTVGFNGDVKGNLKGFLSLLQSSKNIKLLSFLGSIMFKLFDPFEVVIRPSKSLGLSFIRMWHWRRFTNRRFKLIVSGNIIAIVIDWNWYILSW